MPRFLWTELGKTVDGRNYSLFVPNYKFFFCPDYALAITGRKMIEKSGQAGTSEALAYSYELLRAMTMGMTLHRTNGGWEFRGPSEEGSSLIPNGAVSSLILRGWVVEPVGNAAAKVTDLGRQALQMHNQEVFSAVAKLLRGQNCPSQKA